MTTWKENTHLRSYWQVRMAPSTWSAWRRGIRACHVRSSRTRWPAYGPSAGTTSTTHSVSFSSYIWGSTQQTISQQCSPMCYVLSHVSPCNILSQHYSSTHCCRITITFFSASMQDTFSQDCLLICCLRITYSVSRCIIAFAWKEWSHIKPFVITMDKVTNARDIKGPKRRSYCTFFYILHSAEYAQQFTQRQWNHTSIPHPQWRSHGESNTL